MTHQRDTGDKSRRDWKIHLASLTAHIKLCPVENTHSFQTRVEHFRKVTMSCYKVVSHTLFSWTTVPRSPKLKNALLNKSWLKEAISQNGNYKIFTLETE